MIQFTLNKQKIEIPSDWNDLTYKQYVDYLASDGRLTSTLSIFTGIPQDVISKADITGLEQLIITLSFLTKPAQFKDTGMNIGKYKLPLNERGEYDIQFESLGQFEDMRALMAKAGTTDGLLNAYAGFVSIYLQKVLDGDYDYSKAIAMIPEIESYNAAEVINLGSFFILRLSNLLTGTPTSSPDTAPSQKKSKQASPRSPKSSGATRPSRKSR